eukprot:scaffold212936_cov33-Tisochrysis_lutea.AAC.1
MTPTLRVGSGGAWLLKGVPKPRVRRGFRFFFCSTNLFCRRPLFFWFVSREPLWSVSKMPVKCLRHSPRRQESSLRYLGKIGIGARVPAPAGRLHSMGSNVNG